MTFNRLAWNIILQYRGEYIPKISLRSVDSEKSPELPFNRILVQGQLRLDVLSTFLFPELCRIVLTMYEVFSGSYSSNFIKGDLKASLPPSAFTHVMQGAEA